MTLKGKLYTHMTLIWVTGLLHEVHTPSHGKDWVCIYSTLIVKCRMIWFLIYAYKEVLSLIYKEEGYVQNPCSWRMQAKLVCIYVFARLCLQSKATLL